MEMSPTDYVGPAHACAGPHCRGEEHQSGAVFDLKDSGQRMQFKSGMVRDTSENKAQWHRTADGPMLRRWAEHMAKGAAKYPDNADGTPNWTLANSREEYNQFRWRAFRHFMQWYNGKTDEDHASATFFNINGAEYVKERLPK